MKHICSFCGEEFEGWPDKPVISGLFDNVRLAKRDWENDKTLILNYKCCPDCSDMILNYLRGLEIMYKGKSELPVITVGLKPEDKDDGKAL